MTNAELIAALRYCKDHEQCDHDASTECPYEHHWTDGEDCQNLLLADAADAIERLMAEVDRKDKAIQGLLTQIERKDKTIERMRDLMKHYKAGIQNRIQTVSGGKE